MSMVRIVNLECGSGWKANRECDSRMAFMGMTIWIRGARPQTLPLGLAPVLVGVAASWRWEALGGLRSVPSFSGKIAGRA